MTSSVNHLVHRRHQQHPRDPCCRPVIYIVFRAASPTVFSGNGRPQRTSNDKPVCISCRVCSGYGKTIVTKGTLAIRDGVKYIFPRRRPSWLSPPLTSKWPRALYTRQHTSHSTKFSRCSNSFFKDVNDG